MRVYFMSDVLRLDQRLSKACAATAGPEQTNIHLR